MPLRDAVRKEDILVEEEIEVKVAKITIPFEEITRGQMYTDKHLNKTAGQTLLEAGIRISPAEIVVMASVGAKRYCGSSIAESAISTG